MTKLKIPLIILNNGKQIPAIGFGIGSKWRVLKTINDGQQRPETEKYRVDESLISTVKTAVGVGLVHLDGAQAYYTRQEIAEGIKGVPRELLFITDKYSNSNFVKDEYISIESSLDTALEELKLDYLDLWMLHSTSEPPGSSSIEDRWASLEAAYAEGKVRSLGLSNLFANDLKRILKVAKVKPQVLQVYYHALCQHPFDELIALAKEHDIVVEAYSSLAPVTQEVKSAVQKELQELLQELAIKYEKTANQILLRWTIQQGFLPVSTTGKKERMEELADLFSFELDKVDHDAITELGKDTTESFNNKMLSQRAT